LIADYYAAMLAMKGAIAADAPLSDWCTATFGKAPTIMIGNRAPKHLAGEKYPLLMLVAQESETTADEINVGVGFGLFEDDYDTALANLGQMQSLVIDALNNNQVFTVQLGTTHPDGQIFHPKHHMVIDTTCFDFAIDLNALNDLVTFHAESQLDADAEPELITEEDNLNV